MVKFTIEVSEETAKRINELVIYENTKNHLWKKERTVATDEDIIKAAIFRYLEILDKYYELINPELAELRKPFKLKNRFKQILKEETNMKQLDLSEKTHIDKGNLSMILNNKTQPSLDYFLRIWVTLDCPPIEDVLYREL